MARSTDGREVCVVMVFGHAIAQAGARYFGTIGRRALPVEGNPYSVYVPAQSTSRLLAETACEVAVCSAPAKGVLPAWLIAPEAVGQEIPGKGTNVRHVRNILPDTDAAEAPVVVEMIIPGGHRSSSPPHMHDTDDAPRETYLEESYDQRLARAGGFAVQRVYTDDRSLNETMAVGDRDVVLVPHGYHPVGVAHGFDLYFLTVMAGPVRTGHLTVAPVFAFLGW
jgi:5-deoxy-glucuronate isomerase